MRELDFDIVVLGAGSGGCACAIVAERKGASVALVSKEAIAIGNTRLSEAAVTSSGVMGGDSPEALKEDMIKGGEYLNNIELVDLVAKNASSAIDFMEKLGRSFRRGEVGKLSVKAADRLGGHSFYRIFYNTGSGLSLAHALRNVIASAKTISVFEDTLVTSLIQEEGEIKGAFAVDLKASDLLVLKGKPLF